MGGGGGGVSLRACPHKGKFRNSRPEIVASAGLSHFKQRTLVRQVPGVSRTCSAVPVTSCDHSQRKEHTSCNSQELENSLPEMTVATCCETTNNTFNSTSPRANEQCYLCSAFSVVKMVYIVHHFGLTSVFWFRFSLYWQFTRTQSYHT